MDLDVQLPRFDDEDNILAVAEPFSAMEAPDRHLHTSPSEFRREHESSESAVAPLPRKARAPKQLPVDVRQELHNADLARWKADYAENMAEAIKARKSHKVTALAKKNAAFWVVGTGIGGVGAGLGTSKLKSPLDMFAGDSMLAALTGVKTVTSGLKRGRDSEEDDSDSEARRVRMRDGYGDQIGRGDGMILDDEEGTMPMSAGQVVFDPTLPQPEIDLLQGVELGRHAQTPLEDPSFPWNVSSAVGSRQGSLVRGRGFASSVGGLPTSAGRPSSLPGVGGVLPSSMPLERRASRMPSASPLIGRGSVRYSSLELPYAADDDDVLGIRRTSDSQALDEFQLYGPGAAVDTQTAADSQWVRATLNQEASNFLAFVEAKITEVPIPEDEEEDELAGHAQPKTSISFEEMLPPRENTKIVAAQALYHVLALATKGLIDVEQSAADAQIEISLPAVL